MEAASGAWVVEDASSPCTWPCTDWRPQVTRRLNRSEPGIPPAAGVCPKWLPQSTTSAIYRSADVDEGESRRGGRFAPEIARSIVPGTSKMGVLKLPTRKDTSEVSRRRSVQLLIRSPNDLRY